MENENSEFFYLPILLKQDNLNIRGLAKANPSLSVDEYFRLLWDVINLAPDVNCALSKFANLIGDKDACRCLDNIIRVLEDLGCKRFLFVFHSLLNAYGKKGNWREAAIHARQIMEEFSELHSFIMSSIRTRRINDAPDGALPLKQYIQLLDEEEANRKMLILAVDDSPVILKSVSSVLGNGYKVITLLKPTMVENLLRQMTPELFLLDYQMPELTGFDLVPIIRSHEDHKETPIIILTSEGTIDNVTAALAMGICDFVTKPFNPNVLREKIAKWIVRKRHF